MCAKKTKNKSIVKSKEQKALKAQNKKLAKGSQDLTYKLSVGGLEKRMLKIFPVKYAFEWDKTGLCVGDPQAKIKRVAVALDPTVKAVQIAAEKGCNLLLTHHPAFLENPSDFKPADSVAKHDGALVYEAIKNGVALMNFHTALDVSKQGLHVLPQLLNLSEKKVLCPNPQNNEFGIARICNVKSADKNITLEQFAARCKSIFGKAPRVWGDFSSKLNKIVTNNGSTGSAEKDGVIDRCIQEKVDCLVAGEIKYHDAVALSQAGVCIIELGHDMSEIPLCAVLIKYLQECGIQKNDIVYIDQSNNWNYQEPTLL